MNIYVGNLPPDATEAKLRELFESHGHVDTVKIIKDRYTNESRGFGFVEMPVKAEAQAAIAAIDKQELSNKKLIVNEARARRDDRRRGGGGHRGGRGW